ncbi:SphA family protein [Paraburkholderia oxyphila]|uniref:SphA family protein n=1 Tax=Paraburkholderia oxyphila TaxID=614212 RepID=UPI000480DD43|nr:transporter [Paraburkholderia oxyphila]
MINRKNAACVLAALFLVLARTASSTENGLTTYPLGVNTVLDGILPPPGATQFYNYTEYYFANKFSGPGGKSAIPDFHSEALVDAARVVHTWGGTLGPFTWSSGVVVPVVHLHLDVPGASGTRTAPGDIIAQPFMIGYSNPSHTFFAFLTNDISLPSGAYSVNRLANTGVNYYAYQPNLSMTWFPGPQWELSATAQVEFHSPNHATNYHSGDVASLDYLIGYSVTPKVQIGLQGYFLKQFTDDTVNGQTAPGDGFRGQTIGVGPQLRYDLGPGAAIAFKYQHEFAVRNRPQGDRLWVQFAFPV